MSLPISQKGITKLNRLRLTERLLYQVYWSCPWNSNKILRQQVW